MSQEVMETGVKTPGLLMVAGCLAGGLLGGVMSRSRGSVAFGLALGALGGAVGDYMLKLKRDCSSQELAQFLGERLGEDVTAYLSGIENPEIVRAWALGQEQPSPEEMSRLRVAYEATRCLSDVYGDVTIRSWFFGMNPWLEDCAPAYVLRHLNGETRDLVLSAAQEFAEN
jgi:hypothetical protein